MSDIDDLKPGDFIRATEMNLPPRKLEPKIDVAITKIVGKPVLCLDTRLTKLVIKFKQKNGITIDLLSDFKRDVSRSYGVLLEDKFFTQRAYFIIDKNGVLTWMHIEDELGHKRDNAELLEQLGQVG